MGTSLILKHLFYLSAPRSPRPGIRFPAYRYRPCSPDLPDFDDDSRRYGHVARSARKPAQIHIAIAWTCYEQVTNLVRTLLSKNPPLVSTMTLFLFEVAILTAPNFLPHILPNIFNSYANSGKYWPGRGKHIPSKSPPFSFQYNPVFLHDFVIWDTLIFSFFPSVTSI